MKKLLLAALLALLASASASAQNVTPQARQTFASAIVARGPGVNENAGGIQYHQITWTVTGTVTTCQVELDSSADGIVWSGTVIATQTCTANGASAVSALTVANFVSINVTTKSGTGTVSVTYLGWVASPAGVPAGTVTACGGAASPDIGVFSAPTVLCGNAALTSPNLGEIDQSVNPATSSIGVITESDTSDKITDVVTGSVETRTVTNAAATASTFFELGANGLWYLQTLPAVSANQTAIAGDNLGNINLVAGSGTLGHINLTGQITTFEDCGSVLFPNCLGAISGGAIVSAGATTRVVNTTSITNNSEVFVFFDSSLGTKMGVTCNTTVVLPTVTARTAGTSFTITVPAAPVTNPACYSWSILTQN